MEDGTGPREGLGRDIQSGVGIIYQKKKKKMLRGTIDHYLYDRRAAKAARGSTDSENWKIEARAFFRRLKKTKTKRFPPQKPLFLSFFCPAKKKKK